SLEPGILLAYLQSFLLLVDWIIDASGTDFSRRFFTKYIDPFPPDYIKRVLDNDYQPDMESFINDYLEQNPTRNRPLDMLPIFYELDKTRLMQRLPEDQKELVKGRPAFHYRLPDCRVGEKHWTVAREWNHWVLIETLVS